MKIFRFALFALLLAAPLMAQEPTARALVIGIKGYPSKNFGDNQRLRYADADAISFYNFITSAEGGGFKKENVALLLNEKATYSAIMQAVRDLEGSGSSDMVYIFFSGHGVKDTREFGYFMSYYADPENPTDGGIRADRFVEEIKQRVNVKHLVFFIDACFAGAAFGGGLAKGGDDNIVVDILNSWKNVRTTQEEVSMAFLSARANQKSYEDPNIEHGVFTWYLIKGLRGAADSVEFVGNRDGIVTAEELNLYVWQRVREHVKALVGREQIPTVSPNFVGSLPMRLTAHRADESFSAAQAFYNRGLQQVQARDTAGAIASYKEALRLDPNFASAYNNLGVALFSSNVDSAGKLFLMASQRDPSHAMYHFNVALVNGKKGRTADAIKEHQEAIRLDPKYPRAHYVLGLIYEDQNDIDAAIAEYRETVRIDSVFKNAHATLGRALVKINDLSNAIAAFQKAQSNGSAVRTELDSAIAKQNRLRAAAALARDSLSKSSRSWQDLLGVLHDQLHDFPAAYRLTYDSVIRRGNNKSEVAAEWVETLFTTHQFSIVDSETTRLLATQTLTTRHRIVVRALQIAALYGMDRADAANLKLGELAAVVASQPDTFNLNWNFGGSKFFLRTQRDPTLQANRVLLLQMLTALETGARAKILAQLPKPQLSTQLQWVKCDNSTVWCGLNNVDLTSAHFDGMAGVYVAWYSGANPQTLRVGQGNIRSVISALRSDGELQSYASQGSLLITWASAPADMRNGVEKYLIDRLAPKLGDTYPYRIPVLVNLPPDWK